jgi:hypothetical protein
MQLIIHLWYFRLSQCFDLTIKLMYKFPLPGLCSGGVVTVRISLPNLYQMQMNFNDAAVSHAEAYRSLAGIDNSVRIIHNESDKCKRKLRYLKNGKLHRETFHICHS